MIADTINARVATIAAMVEKRNPLGRTAMMKLCYFLQTLRNVPLGYRFTLYSYGPFDASVLSDISSAESLGGIKSRTFFYAGGYGYEISPARKNGFVKDLDPKFIKKYNKDFDWVIATFGNFGSADLELLSTIVYVDRESANAKKKQLVQILANKVQEIKPHFNLPAVQSKVEFLREENLLNSLRD